MPGALKVCQASTRSCSSQFQLCASADPGRRQWWLKELCLPLPRDVFLLWPPAQPKAGSARLWGVFRCKFQALQLLQSVSFVLLSLLALEWMTAWVSSKGDMRVYQFYMRDYDFCLHYYPYDTVSEKMLYKWFFRWPLFAYHSLVALIQGSNILLLCLHCFKMSVWFREKSKLREFFKESQGCYFKAC